SAKPRRLLRDRQPLALRATIAVCRSIRKPASPPPTLLPPSALTRRLCVWEICSTPPARLRSIPPPARLSLEALPSRPHASSQISAPCSPLPAQTLRVSARPQSSSKI